MSEVEELRNDVAAVTNALTESNATLVSLDTKVDEIRAYIATLTGGATAAQITELRTMVGAAKTLAEEGRTATAAALAEVDALDEPTPNP